DRAGGRDVVRAAGEGPAGEVAQAGHAGLGRPAERLRTLQAAVDAASDDDVAIPARAVGGGLADEGLGDAAEELPARGLAPPGRNQRAIRTGGSNAKGGRAVS